MFSHVLKISIGSPLFDSDQTKYITNKIMSRMVHYLTFLFCILIKLQFFLPSAAGGIAALGHLTVGSRPCCGGGLEVRSWHFFTITALDAHAVRSTAVLHRAAIAALRTALFGTALIAPLLASVDSSGRMGQPHGTESARGKNSAFPSRILIPGHEGCWASCDSS
jgi:hypothetical protein